MSNLHPNSLETNVRPAVDRAARQALTELIQRYLNSEITAFAFDDGLDAFRNCPDPSAQHVVGQLWYFYDDCTDHLVALDKPSWDYHQRLLLLLASDGCVIATQRRRWGNRQMVAWAGLVGYGVLACWLAQTAGWKAFVLAGIPFGIVAHGLIWNRRPPRPSIPLQAILCPFGSLSELAQAIEATGLVKTRCPPDVAARRIRSPGSDFLQRMHSFLAAWIAAPFMLLIEAFPDREFHTRVAFESTARSSSE